MEIDKLLPDVKISKVEYSLAHKTFLITGLMQGVTITKAFNKVSFPAHAPFQFLDEKVQIGEKVWIYLKPEGDLRLQGYADVGKHSLQGKGFKIGKEKRKLLGSVHEAIIGLDEKWRPIAFIGAYRFSIPEVKCIITTGPTAETKHATIGGLVFDKPSHCIYLPDGTRIASNYVADLKKLLTLANL